MTMESLASLRAPILVGVLISLLVLERMIPLRVMTQPKFKRLAINLALALLAAAFIKLIVLVFVVKVSALTMDRGWGLLPLLRAGTHFPYWVETLLAVAFLDWTLYYWHLMNHRYGFLWRFHNVHHCDLDMDVTTASRFHFGELFFSAFYRSGQIILFGIDPLQLLIFETLVTVSAQFHHSNLRLPIGLERALNCLFVTPRMHGVHHSIVQGETDSNFSAIFSFWDRLHRTLRLGIRQKDITIGVAAYRDPAELTFLRALVLPFTRPRAWRLPDGRVPKREFDSNVQGLLP